MLMCNIKMQKGGYFGSLLGVRQGECFSPFIFAMDLNDLEDELFLKGAEGIDIGILTSFC